MGVIRIVTAHHMRNLRLLSDGEVDALHRQSHGDTAHTTERGLPAAAHPWGMDALRSRVEALAAEARGRDLIGDHEFLRWAKVAGVPEEARMNLLATSGPSTAVAWVCGC